MPNEAKDGGAGFTAGPWELIEEPTGNDNFARSIYGPAGDYKALLIARCDQNFSHADGQLIVAAPDLYAALRWAEAALAPFSKEPAEKSGMTLIRNALAKADGRS